MLTKASFADAGKELEALIDGFQEHGGFVLKTMALVSICIASLIV